MSSDFETIQLSGEAYARGAAYGATRRQRIQACLSAWLESLRGAGVADPSAHVAQLLRETDFLSSIREHTPDLLDEIRGIAVGAGQTFDLLLAAQLMDEEWAYRSSAVEKFPAPEKCSSVAVRAAADSVLIGQNMDLGGYTDGHQVVLQVAPHETEPGALIFSISSMIALFGVNTRRIAVCVNSIPQLPAARHGLPVAFIIRKLLQARTLMDAVDLVQTLPHATAQHYLIADAGSIRSFEAAPGRVVEYESPDPTGVLHTNHPLAHGWGGTYAQSLNSIARLKSLQARLGTGQPDVESIKAALSASDDPDHPVSRVGGPSSPAHPLTGMISFTTGSMISALRLHSDTVDVWISPGPPSIHGYTHRRFP